MILPQRLLCISSLSLTQNGHTALHYAASLGKLGTVTLLLGSGIDVDITNHVRTLTLTLTAIRPGAALAFYFDSHSE